MAQISKSASMNKALPLAPSTVAISDQTPVSELQAILRQTLSALTHLDADRLETMVLACEHLSERLSVDDVKAALEEHRALECLLAETATNLKFLMRLNHQGESPAYTLAMTS